MMLLDALSSISHGLQNNKLTWFVFVILIKTQISKRLLKLVMISQWLNLILQMSTLLVKMIDSISSTMNLMVNLKVSKFKSNLLDLFKLKTELKSLILLIFSLILDSSVESNSEILMLIPSLLKLKRITKHALI